MRPRGLRGRADARASALVGSPQGDHRDGRRAAARPRGGPAGLGDDAALRQDVLVTVDATLPGLVDTGDDRGGPVDPDELVLSTGLSLAGLAAIGALLFSASLSMAALRTAARVIRAR